MGVVYGLYSTREGTVRHVGQAADTAAGDLDMLVTKALDQESGALFDWIRNEWRLGCEIRPYIIQDQIVLADLEMFETYWVAQFDGLLTAAPSANPNHRTTALGERINDAIATALRGGDAGATEQA